MADETTLLGLVLMPLKDLKRKRNNFRSFILLMAKYKSVSKRRTLLTSTGDGQNAGYFRFKELLGFFQYQFYFEELLSNRSLDCTWKTHFRVNRETITFFFNL